MFRCYSAVILVGVRALFEIVQEHTPLTEERQTEELFLPFFALALFSLSLSGTTGYCRKTPMASSRVENQALLGPAREKRHEKTALIQRLCSVGAALKALLPHAPHPSVSAPIGGQLVRESAGVAAFVDLHMQGHS